MTGIPAGNIALCASHTHGGPATRAYGRERAAGRRGLPGAPGDSTWPGRWPAAARELRPVALRLGRGRAGFNVNRRVRTPGGR